jgi:phytoene synthase
VSAGDNARYCAALVRAGDHDRYLATLFAPAAQRDALYALYAFNLEVGRVGAAVHEPMAGEIRLQWWRDVVSGGRDGEAAANPVAAALLAAMARHRLDADRLAALIDAHRADLYEDPFASLDDLDNHAALTEAGVLASAAQILGAHGLAVETLARHAGIAGFIARGLVDLPRLAARRRLPLPAELLERHGAQRNAILAGQDAPPLRAALAELRRHAWRQLQAARLEAGEVPESMLPALLPLAPLGAALKRMERRGYEPFAPEPLSRFRRQWLIWRAARDASRIFAV